MPKLTKREVEKVEPGARDVVVWDDELHGFGLRVRISGSRSYFVQYRNAAGRSRWLTLGQHGRITAEQARKKAAKALLEVSEGKDPAEMRDERRAAPTIRELAERYLREHAEPKKRPSSVASDRGPPRADNPPRLRGPRACRRDPRGRRAPPPRASRDPDPGESRRSAASPR